MQPKDSKKKKDEKDETEAVPKHDPFDPFPFEAKNAETAILLLQSKEKSILLAAVKALSQYASKSTDNIKMLFDIGIVKNILPIVEHEDIFTRRFAAKLLVEIIIIPEVITYLIEYNYIQYFAKLLTTEEDIFMQEYFSVILANLSKDPCGTALLVEYCLNMDFLFEKLQSPDPDVKNNTIRILYNLMHDPAGAYKILKSQKFNFSMLFQHFESSYPEIQQLALNIVAAIIGINKDEDTQSLFLKANGVQTLLDFLKNDEWSDLHIEALRILSQAAENPAVVNELINSEGIPQILSYIENPANPELFTEAIKVIAHIANTSDGRKILHSYGIVGYLIDTFKQSTQSDVIEITCHAIGKMALYNLAAEELASGKLIENILDVLKNEDLQWSTRHTASYALKQLLMSDIRNCDIFLNLRGQDYLLQLVKQSEKQVPAEICIIALKALIVVARRLSLRNYLISFNTIDAICFFLESTYPYVDEFKIACCNLLSALCLEKDGKRYLLEANGPEKLYALITDAYSVPVRNSMVQLIQTISTDLVVADAFIKSRYLPYMLNNRSPARVISSWDTCIETLFKSHLPAKFAFTGRLSLHDVTQDGFYVVRKGICPFPALDEIFRLKCSPIEPIYAVNFSRPSTPSNALQNDLFFEGDITSRFELRHGRLQYDPYLVEYVELFKCMLSETESKDATTDLDIGLTNVRYISSRSKMLAEFVARQMSGFDPENKCIPSQLEVHLRKIKEHLETNVIPLGHLRVGSYLERALLFKVIADRICLPAALVRGGYGISWIEIAIPRIDVANEERLSSARLNGNAEYRSETIIFAPSELYQSDIRLHDDDKYKTKEISSPRDDRSTVYPIKYMKPNFIVDLMDTPGDLIPIGSPRSKLYCTVKLTCDQKCCQ